MLIAMAIMIPLISIANAGIVDGLLGHTNSTTTILQNATQSTPQNTTIVTNQSAGNLTLTSSSGQQYNYQVILPKTLINGSDIFTFYLLGYYNNRLGYQFPAKVSCNTTSQINCTAVFIVTLGSFDRLEVIRDGVWLYALKLPTAINTGKVQSVTTVNQKTNNNLSYILYVFGGIALILLVGNIAYDAYAIRKNPNAYNEVN